jgi:pyruvate/2-oxoglutarate dehydrogenase complex dihydrolipoamide acyltransferase (E2) component
MPTAITTPRINNNDDLVRFSQILSPPGSAVQKGDPIAEIETDKATFTIEADESGYILEFVQPLGEMIPVGSVLVWLGSSPEEAIPAAENSAAATVAHGEPTLKATILLTRFGLNASEVPATGERLTAQEVLDFAQRRNLQSHGQGISVEPEAVPLAPGETLALSISERAMLKSVLWQRQSAVPGYVEIEYDTRAWDEYANAYQHEHNMLLSPLLPLMAWRLAQLAGENPKLNCTIVGDKLHHYNVVNLGFTLQSEARLSLLSVRDAAKLSMRQFVERLVTLMRQGMKGKLTPEETTGITTSFSSMARWQVSRHIPVLPPYTSLIVAHAHSRNGVAALGGAYDHRVLMGGEVAVALRSLSEPPKGKPKGSAPAP